MAKIIGNTTATPNPRPDWNQVDETKADYIKNKPELGAIAAKSEISKSDLALDVQESLEKADGAIQTLDGYATETYVDGQIATLVNSAPETLDTLNELATALGDDPNFATTVATQLGNKVDKVAGKGLSTNDFTTAEKNKLAGIAAGAEVNVQSNWDQTQTNNDAFIQNKPAIKKGATKNSIIVGSVTGNEADLNKATNEFAFAEGKRTTASGLYTHAEGVNTVASGHGSHAEGSGTQAIGIRAHSQGYKTIASGEDSHAEGVNTVASGYRSHAEGYETVAKGACQHVQGQGNIIDENNQFLHIVGNGWIDEDGNLHRGNAHTLDWGGNAWYSGEIRVGWEKSKVLSEQDFYTYFLDFLKTAKATDPVRVKAIKEPQYGAWMPSFDFTNPDAKDEIIINANETIIFALPQGVTFKFSLQAEGDSPATVMVKEGEVELTPGGATLPPNSPVEFSKGLEFKHYTISVTSGMLKIFNIITEITGLIAPGGDVNLTNGVITIKDEVKESLGGTKVVTRNSTSITGEELLLCNTKYHYTEPINTMYLHYDLFKGSGENGAFRLSDEWDITFKVAEGFSFGYELNFELDQPIPSFSYNYPYFTLHLRYVEDGEYYQRRFIASLKKYNVSPVE